MKLYAIQIKVCGKWEFGPRMYGIDVMTGLVGPYFMSRHSMMLVKSRLESEMLPNCIRVIEADINIPED